MLEGPGKYPLKFRAKALTPIHNDIYPAISPTAFTLTNKTVFITGRSKGIGRSMALSYALAGATHIAVGARSPLSQLATDIEAAAKSANRSTPTFLPIQLDVTDPNSVSSAASIVHEKFGKIDILINNAGIIGSFGLTGDVNVGRANHKSPRHLSRHPRFPAPAAQERNQNNHHRHERRRTSRKPKSKRLSRVENGPLGIRSAD